MVRNIVIGILAIGIIVLGWFYFSQKASVVEVVTPTPVTPIVLVTPPAPVPVPPPTPVAPVAGAPLVVTGANASVSSSTAVVSGQVKPNGALTTYWYEYGLTTALGARSTAQQIGSGFSLVSTPAFITGLKASTVYYYRLSAQNRFATVNGDTLNFQTNTAPAPVGTAPVVSTKAATVVTRTTANLNGAVNPKGFATDFWYEYGTDNTLGNVTTVQSAGNGSASSDHSASISNLAPLTKYFFRVDAQNQFGTVNGSILNFTTLGPAAVVEPTVSTLAATNIAATAARLNGRINPNGTSTDYWFEYSLDSALSTLLNSGASVTTLNAGTSNVDVNLDVSGLTSATTYFYRVVGRNSAGTVQGAIMSFNTAD